MREIDLGWVLLQQRDQFGAYWNPTSLLIFVPNCAVLVAIAQRSLDLASGSPPDDQLDAVLREFNDQKMSEH